MPLHTNPCVSGHNLVLLCTTCASAHNPCVSGHNLVLLCTTCASAHNPCVSGCNLVLLCTICASMHNLGASLHNPCLCTQTHLGTTNRNAPKQHSTYNDLLIEQVLVLLISRKSLQSLPALTSLRNCTSGPVDLSPLHFLLDPACRLAS